MAETLDVNHMPKVMSAGRDFARLALHFSSAMPKRLLAFEVYEVWGIKSRK
jgi:hypothetical protein